MNFNSRKIKVHFSNINHSLIGRLTLNDMYDFLSGGLREHGIETTIGPYIDRSCLNIFWDNFDNFTTKEILNEKFTYGLISTEIPTDKTLNFNFDSMNLQRANNFREITKRSKFIWSMTEIAVEYYEALAPTFYIELGYSKFCEPKEYMRTVEPDFDIGFYGLPNSYRDEILKRLSSHFKVCWPNQQNLYTTEELQFFIQRCKYGISLGQSRSWTYPSQSRLARFYNSGRQVICEPFHHHTYKYNFAKKIDLNNISEVIDKIDLKSWKIEGIKIHENFSKNFLMRNQLTDFLNTISIDVLPSFKSYYYNKKIDQGRALESNLNYFKDEERGKINHKEKKKGIINRLKRSLVKRLSN